MRANRVRQPRLRPVNLMQQGPTAGRGDENLMRAREAVAMAVLAGLIHVEAVMGVLDGRHGKTRSAQQRQQRDEQGRLAAAGPADDPQDFQDGPSTRLMWEWVARSGSLRNDRLRGNALRSDALRRQSLGT